MDDNHQNEEDGDCSNLAARELRTELESAIADSDNKNIIIAIHHPLVSYWQFAGYKNGAMHFAPPIIGSFRNIHRKHIGGQQRIKYCEVLKL